MHLSAELKPVNGVFLESLVKVLWGESPDAATEVPLTTNLPCHKQRTEGERGCLYTWSHATGKDAHKQCPQVASEPSLERTNAYGFTIHTMSQVSTD